MRPYATGGVAGPTRRPDPLDALGRSFVSGGGSIRFDAEPARSLARLPQGLRRHVATELGRLLRRPGTQRIRPTSTHGSGRLSDVQTSLEGMDVFIDIVFKYAADEETLLVTHVSVDVA